MIRGVRDVLGAVAFGRIPLEARQVLLRICVAETHEAIAIFTEAAAVEGGDSSFVEQQVGQVLRGHAGAGNVGECVEGAAG